MPNVSCLHSELMRLIDADLNDQEFEDICMSYGMELDEIVEEPERHSNIPVKTFKIDVGANRADLLCVEGIARALRVFMGKAKTDQIKVKQAQYSIQVSPSVKAIRGYIASAVVRNVKFDQRSYNSFIDHQDKLHQNVCRRRSLVAIGTHDLKKIDPRKITYAGEKPEAAVFVALNQTEIMNGRQLFDILRNDKKLKEYLPLIENSPVWPVLRDGRGEILSLPPIINSEYSKIDLSTRDIFIDVTATDRTKALIALNAVINGLLMHSETPLEVEAVNIMYEDIEGLPLLSSKVDVTPQMAAHPMEVEMNYVRTITGVPLEPEDAIQYLQKMSIDAVAQGQKLVCQVPFQRADVLHAIDLVEDIAIGFGYNKIAEEYSYYPLTMTIGGSLKEFRVQENIRQECAASGYIECLLFSLCGEEDAVFGEPAVVLSNPKTATFTRVRSQLVPGLIRACVNNQSRPLPIQLFECSEVVVHDYDNAANDTNVTTVYKLAALYAGATDGFGLLHGLLDRIAARQGLEVSLKPEDGALFLAGRRAAVTVGGKKIGWIGVLAPAQLLKLGLDQPVSAFEVEMKGLM